MNKKVSAAVFHHEREVAELRADRELVVEYLKAAMESLDDPDNRAAGFLGLRTVAEANGGLLAKSLRSKLSVERTRYARVWPAPVFCHITPTGWSKTFSRHCHHQRKRLKFNGITGSTACIMSRPALWAAISAKAIPAHH